MTKLLIYPRLLRRLQAILIDSLVLPCAIIIFLLLGDAIGIKQTWGRALCFLLPIFIFEPGLVAFTGGTVGHHLMKLRVATMDGKRNINIFAALIRFVVKFAVGLLSLSCVLITRQHQALHDLLARSIVVYKNPIHLSAREALSLRLPDANYIYPRVWRRVLVTLMYIVLATMLLGILMAIVVSKNCVEHDVCSVNESFVVLGLEFVWLFAMGWILVKVWNGHLYGCRRKLIERDNSASDENVHE